MNSTWTEARVAQLTELWLAGTATLLIGVELGMSKNAVVGKAHRLGLPRRESPITYSGKAAKGQPKLPPARKALDDSRPNWMLSHRMAAVGRFHSGACQWIENDPSADDTCKCGAPTGASRVYCSEHEGKAWCPAQVEEEVA